MKRRDFLVTAAAFSLLPSRSHARGVTALDISHALNDLTTAKTRFVQINSDGSRSEGTIYIRRPGRMRFEYDAPSAALVVVGGSQVAVFDLKSNQAPDVYPLKETPLYVLLEPTVNLTQSHYMKGIIRGDEVTTLVARDPEHPEYGSIDLQFSNEPIALKGWVMTNQSGEKTRVHLGPLQQGMRLSNALFDIQHTRRELGL